MNALSHPIAENWLARFDRAAAALPQPRRAELRAELVEHLEALIAEGEPDLAAAVARLGDPAEIVAAEGVPTVSAAQSHAATGLLLLPLTGLLFLVPALPPGLLSMAVILLAASTVLVLVLRSGATAQARALGVLGALAPPLAGLGGILDKVFQAGVNPGVNLPLGPGKELSVSWHTDPWLAGLGQIALLALGLGLPVLAGLRLRRPAAADSRLFLGALALLVTAPVGLATALLLSGARRGGEVGTLVSTPLIVLAAVLGVLLLAVGALLVTRPGLALTAKALIALAVVTAPIGVVLLAQHNTGNNGIIRQTALHPLPADAEERRRVASAWYDEDQTQVIPAAAYAPGPAWVPADRNVRLGLGLLFVLALPLLAAWRTGVARQ
ncbi:HAAS signaling domain-containing protein [Crossiella sp. CA198]|uniref:HAAS signaling domain-containing protein n=1 Tax=Crossiella sp. CA198 TaxID=3455607 RepID=UPI003F8D72F0